MTKYSFKIGLQKGMKYFIIFGLPILVTGFIDNFPAIANLTIGGVLVIIMNYAKIQTKSKLL